MISVRCSCGGEMWVRDRLAGQSAHCPSCQGALSIPPIDIVHRTMDSCTCACGEAFWAESWKPGRKCKCPLCGLAVGPATGQMPSGVAGPRKPDQATGVGTSPEKGSGGSRATRSSGRAGTRVAGLATAFLMVAAVVGWHFWPVGGKEPSHRVEGAPVTPSPKDPGVNPPAKSGPNVTPEEPPGSPSPPVTEVEPKARGELRLIVPAYFYPGGKGLADWDRLGRAASKVQVVIIANPGSGPGQDVNGDYRAAIRAAVRSGAKVIGYVNTDYGKRPASVVEEDIARWVQFYPDLGGFFFDAQASQGSASHLEYYSKIREYARRQLPSPLIVSNPGTVCDREFVERDQTNVTVLFENSKDFDRFEPPVWAADFDPDRFAALPYAIADEKEMQNCLQGAVLKGFGYLFVTSRPGPDPWSGLPDYWEAEVELVRRINQRQAF